MSTNKREFFDIEKSELIGVAAIEQIGPVTWSKIRQNFRSLSELLSTNKQKLSGLLTDEQIGALTDRKRIVNNLTDVTLITIDDQLYPPLLKEIADPPLWLFYRGNPETLCSDSLSIVGSRKHTAYAKEALEILISENVANNITITSGLAYGIDKLAHQKSINSNGKTIAVLAGGLDKIYPSAHFGLAKEIIAKGGALISEYPPGSPALPYRFPIRNRIIAGLSRATLIVEAALKSGTISTARSTIDYNRDLFVVPGDINRTTSEGCNYLLGQGAIPLTQSQSLEEYYGLEPTTPGFDQKTATLVNLHSHASISQKILELLSTGGARTMNQLVVETGESIDALLREITLLELVEKIYQERPGYYKSNDGK